MAVTIITRGENIQGGNVSAASLRKDDFQINEQHLHGLDIASGTTLAPAGPQEYFHVTGTSTTSFYNNAFLLDGQQVVLYFVSALTLNHNAGGGGVSQAAFVLSSGANASVAAGQSATFRFENATNKMVQVGGVLGSSSGVVSVGAGTGISVTAGSNPIVSNTGVLAVTHGTGISVTGTGANPVVNNTGVLSVISGTGISSSGGQNPVITNTGIIGLVPTAGVDSTGGQNPIISAHIKGLLQLGGLIPSMGSTTIWFYGGNFASPTRFEFPIESFMANGATTCFLRGYVADFVGPDAVVILTVNGAVVSGSAHGIGVSSIGGAIALGPLTIPAGVNRGMGLAIIPISSSGCAYAATVEFN